MIASFYNRLSLFRAVKIDSIKPRDPFQTNDKQKNHVLRAWFFVHNLCFITEQMAYPASSLIFARMSA